MSRRKDLTQKQKLYIAFFTDPNSPTFDNSYRSAKRAKYAEHTAKRMNHTEQMMQVMNKQSEAVMSLASTAEERRARILDFAERNIEEYVKGVPQDKTDKTIKADMTKFASERLGKTHYSTRTESVVDDNEGFMRGDRASIIEGTFTKYIKQSARDLAQDAPLAIDAQVIETHATPDDTE